MVTFTKVALIKKESFTSSWTNGATPDMLNWQDLPHPAQSITDVEEVKWRKIFLLCTQHKEAALSGLHPNHMLWHKIFPMCIHTRENFTLLSHTSYNIIQKLVEARQVEF